MPGKNALKIYVQGGHYHLYNRGVEKRIIFQDEQDYKVFLKYLKEALSPPPDPKTLRKNFTLRRQSFKGVPRRPKNYVGEIELLAFCLMPNHFHLLIKQKSNNSMEKFARSILTRYSKYFNKRYDRVGPLFQGRYKAVLVDKENYLLHLSRYIHLNPSEYTKDLEGAYSSYSQYLGKTKADWIKPDAILSFFDQATKDFLKGVNTYKKFVENFKRDSQEILDNLTLE